MKKLYWLLILLIPIYFIAENIDFGHRFFHVKVVCVKYNSGIDTSLDGKFYHVEFTSTNWVLSQEIYDFADLTSLHETIDNHKSFDNERDAVLFAKRFKTFRQCQDYNKQVKLMQKIRDDFYSKHPYINTYKPKNDCCKTTQIK